MSGKFPMPIQQMNTLLIREHKRQQKKRVGLSFTCHSLDMMNHSTLSLLFISDKDDMEYEICEFI